MKIVAWGIGSHAQRNTLPALMKTVPIDVVGIYSRNDEIVREQARKYGCKPYTNSEILLADPEIEGVYLATPIALHFSEGRKILEAGKHLFVEKSSVMCLRDAEILAELAKSNNLVIAECFMYKHHNQCAKLLDIIRNEELGAIRQIYACFGFPHLNANDIRYRKKLGGGALLDAGAYTLSLAALFAKNSINLCSATMFTQKSYDVDTDGVATLILDGYISFIASWGMGRGYRNEVEVWGENGTAYAYRFFSKPETLETNIKILKQNSECIIKCPPENHFVSMFRDFTKAVDDVELRSFFRNNFIEQASLVENVLNASINLRST